MFFVKRLLLLVCVINVGVVVSVPYETVVSRYHQIFDFSGTVLVVDQNKQSYLQSIGLANRSFEIENTPQTRNSINSISKLFTTVAALKLIEDGKLDLQATVNHYLPDLKADWSKQITIHQLLSHRSGLPRESGVKWHEQLTFEEQIEKYQNVTLLFVPGKRYEYSNFGMTVMGRILEKVSGLKYHALIEQLIIQPLTLKNTGVYQGRVTVKNQAIGYGLNHLGVIEQSRSKHFGDNAGGGLYSTTQDLYKFIQAIFKGELLNKDSRELMLKNHSNENEEPSGYGFSIQKFGEDDIYMAAGSGYGTKSVVVYVPESSFFIGITANWGNTPIFDLLRHVYLTAKKQEISLPETASLASVKNYDGHLGIYVFDRVDIQKHLQVENDKFILHEVNNKLFLDDELLVEKSEGVLGFTYTDELTITFKDEQMIIDINNNRLMGVKH